MIEQQINGTKFTKIPEPVNGKYRFIVTQIFNYPNKRGENLTVDIPVRVDKNLVEFKPDNGYFVLNVNDDAFSEVEDKAVDCELLVYPRFE